MHYILLSIALNLGKENIGYMKMDDMKNAKKLERTVNNAKNTQKTPVQEIKEDNSIMDQSFLSDDNDFVAPYVGSNEFAELLPEDELGNVITEEEQGPKFIENIKNKLIKVAEKKEPEVIVGSQVEGPSFFDNIKNKLIGDDSGKTKTKEKPKPKDSGAIVASEDIGPSFMDNLKNKVTDAATPKTTTDKNVATIVGSQIEGPSLITKIKEKTKDTAKKITTQDLNGPGFISNIKNKILGKEEKKVEAEEFEKVKIVGTLFDSELNNALKDEKKSQYERDRLNKEMYSDVKEIKYDEDEEYKKFLAEKEDSALVKPEKILIPNIVPRKKEIISYKNKDVPEELLASRSFQNRHIPSIMQDKDRQAMLEKIIEYGMMTEFRAFMNDLRDSNMIMSNQYTLLTYATKNKQHDIMKYLIHIGADVNKRDDRLDTPLNIAVQNNDMNAVQILINANANPNMPDILKRTPLIYCIEKNQEAMGVYLIDMGADVNITNGVGEGTLAMSIRLGRNMIKEKIIEVLRREK